MTRPSAPLRRKPGRPYSRLSGLAALAPAALALACGGSGGKDETKSSIAAALDMKTEQTQVANKLKDKEEAEAKARATKKAEEAAALEAAIVAAAVVPEKYPKKMKAACEAATDAYDQFMRAQTDARVATLWFEGRLKSLGAVRQRCEQRKNPELAACQAHALTHAPAALHEGTGPDGARRLLEACINKLGLLDDTGPKTAAATTKTPPTQNP